MAISLCLYHTVNSSIFLSHLKFVCFNITLCNRLLKYHLFVEALVKNMYIFCFRSSYYNTFCPFYNFLYNTYASLVIDIPHILSHSCFCITLSALFNLFLRHSRRRRRRCPRIWRFCVFSPGSADLVPITPTPVVHFIISHAATTPTTSVYIFCSLADILSCLRLNIPP